MSLSLFYEDGYGDNKLSIKEFIFKYLLPIKILKKDEIKIIMKNNKLEITDNIYKNDRFFNKLKDKKDKKNKNNLINTFINTINKVTLDKEVAKDIRRYLVHIYINNKILFNNSQNELSVMNDNYIIETLNEKLEEEITQDEKTIILIKNTLFQVMPSIYWPYITDHTLFKEYLFLKTNEEEYYFGDIQIFFKSYNELCNINISSLNNKITQHIDYTIDLGIIYDLTTYNNGKPPLYFGKATTKLLIDYTNNSVIIKSDTIIFDAYKIIFDIIKNNPKLPKSTLDIFFNEKIEDLYTKNYNSNKNKTITFFKQKEQTYYNIINGLINLLLINENYANLLYFFIDLKKIFFEKNIEGIFLKFLFNRYEQLNNIINYEDDYSNYYYKIILFYRNLYIFFDEYSEKESDYDQYFNNKEYLNKSLKELLYNFSLKPITKKNISYKSDFLIISYNEDDQIFNENDCISMLYKITIEEPAIIILCTQHSKVKDSFQDFLNNELTNETISKTSFGYKNILQINPSKLFKNSKTTLYIRNNSFLFFEKFLKKDKKDIKQLFSKSKNHLERTILTYDIEKHKIEKKDITSVDNIRNNFFIKKISYGVNNKSIVRKALELSLFKTNIFLELIIEKNSKEYKFIIINTHLYFSKESSDTGLNQRTKEFFDLIDDLKLDNYYKEGYNIFFCGDLNFRLYSIDKKNKNINYKEISNSIISNYLKDNKEEFKQKYETTNELTKIIKERLLSTTKNEQILTRFNKSIMLTGYDLTCKYIKNDTNYKSKINNEIKKENFKLRGNKAKTFPIIPSMCDRILYATKDLNIKSNNFKVYSIPKKSDHKIITLSFELESKKNNQLNKIKYNLNKISPSIGRINDYDEEEYRNSNLNSLN